MSWSLRITNGDLALSGTSLDTVTAEDKLSQDLRCWILEHIGNDDAHPDYGSALDGGVRRNRNVPSLLGRTDSAMVGLEAEAEIRRIVLAYQQQQLSRAQSDRMTYGRATLSRGEVVTGIRSLKVYQLQDGLYIYLTVDTAGRGPLSIDVPLSANS